MCESMYALVREDVANNVEQSVHILCAPFLKSADDFHSSSFFADSGHM